MTNDQQMLVEVFQLGEVTPWVKKTVEGLDAALTAARVSVPPGGVAVITNQADAGIKGAEIRVFPDGRAVLGLSD